MDSKLPAYTKRLCCTKPELTVYMSGTIKGVNHEDFEDWLKKIVPPTLHFEHVAKKEQNMWGYVHFGTHEDASKFYYTMEGKTFSGKSKDSVQFEVKFSKATYYKTGKTVDYVIVIEEDTPYHQYHPYALFVLHENCQSFYVVKFYTPGVNNKEQVEIDVNDDNKSITIIARGLEIEQSENVIFNNLPTKFVVNIDIQKRVNLKERANVVMENGVTTVQFKMLNNKRKRKIQIA